MRIKLRVYYWSYVYPRSGFWNVAQCQIEGATFFHNRCYERNTFPGDCGRKEEEEYDDLCEDGEDVQEDILDSANTMITLQASNTITEAISELEARAFSNNATGLWIRENAFQELGTLDLSTRSIIKTPFNNLKISATSTYDREFRSCPTLFFGSNQLNCDAAISPAIAPNPIMLMLSLAVAYISARRSL